MKDTVIVPWNNIYLEAVRKFGGAPGPIARIGAIMHIAMFDAINALSGNPYKSYLSNLPEIVEGADPAMSAAYAARKVLLQTIDTLINQAATSPGGVPNPFDPHQLNVGFDPKSFLDDWSKRFNMTWEKEDPSRKFGEAVAEAILLKREKDGSEKANDSPAVEFGFTPGDWRETGSGAAVTPQWGKVNPFGGWQTSQINDFLPTTALNVSKFNNYSELLPSRDYAGQIKEVERLGEAHSPERTREQTEIAFFWANDVNGTSKPPGQLYYLANLNGLKPDARGKGIGKGLLKPVLDYADTTQVGCYLVSSNSRNLSFYERYGFQQLYPIQISDSYSMTGMWRDCAVYHP